MHIDWATAKTLFMDSKGAANPKVWKPLYNNNNLTKTYILDNNQIYGIPSWYNIWKNFVLLVKKKEKSGQNNSVGMEIRECSYMCRFTCARVQRRIARYHITSHAGPDVIYVACLGMLSIWPDGGTHAHFRSHTQELANDKALDVTKILWGNLLPARARAYIMETTGRRIFNFARARARGLASDLSAGWPFHLVSGSLACPGHASSRASTRKKVIIDRDNCCALCAWR